MKSSTLAEVQVADEVWIATALLHHENPSREDFAVGEVVARVVQENLVGSVRPGVRTHVSQHCVANKQPDPGRHRMLFETAHGRRRLYRASDPLAPGRTGRVTPERNRIPQRYHFLLDWYRDVYSAARLALESDPILSLRGRGQEIWLQEPADAYVQRLRESWS